MLKTILQKMSNAAGGIWDFDLVGDDPNDSSNCVTKIIDRKFTSNNIYDIQKKKKAFIFHAHKKNSIVRSMTTDVSITGDIAGQVLFSNPTDPDSAFYARGQSDRILKRARISSKDAGTLSADKEKKETEIADASKFIVSIPPMEKAVSTISKLVNTGGVRSTVLSFGLVMLMDLPKLLKYVSSYITLL